MLDKTDMNEDADKYIGLCDDDWIYVIDQGGSVSFLYGADVRLDGTEGTVKTEIARGGSGGDVPYPDIPYPDTNKKMNCPVCGGTGKVICKGCGGLGYIPSIKHSPDYGYGSSVYEVKNHCYTCHGSCLSNCTHCFGTGHIP